MEMMLQDSGGSVQLEMFPGGSVCSLEPKEKKRRFGGMLEEYREVRWTFPF